VSEYARDRTNDDVMTIHSASYLNNHQRSFSGSLHTVKRELGRRIILRLILKCHDNFAGSFLSFLSTHASSNIINRNALNHLIDIFVDDYTIDFHVFFCLSSINCN